MTNRVQANQNWYRMAGALIVAGADLLKIEAELGSVEIEKSSAHVSDL